MKVQVLESFHTLNACSSKPLASAKSVFRGLGIITTESTDRLIEMENYSGTRHAIFLV
jgi:hypothetical protein